MAAWHEKLDLFAKVAGGIVAHVGLITQLGGFVLTFLLGDPIAGEKWLERGFWIAGLGGAGLIYGVKVDAGGSVKYQGGSHTYEPPARRWPTALGTICLTPLWGVLCLPAGIMLYAVLGVGGFALGVVRLVGKARRYA